MRTVHLGDLLVQHGVLTPSQRDEVLIAQKTRGGPFGAIAEQMFGVSAAAVEAAWAEQYSTLAPHVDPRSLEVPHRVLEMISRRQAWQFRVLPISFKGDELVMCTTQEALPKALRFAGWRLAHVCQFVLCEPHQLGQALERHYPMDGMSAASVSERLSA